MNDFDRDNAWQKEVRDTVLVPGFYEKCATNGRYVFLDKGRLAKILQKRSAVDTIFQGKNGTAHFIEEKIVRWPGYHYDAFTLETHSCTVPGHESDGWMVYGEADYLFYCCEQKNRDLVCLLANFPKLQEWFWPLENSFPTFGPLNTLNRTMGRKVPIEDIRANVPSWPFTVEHPDNVKQLTLSLQP